jgi:teichuronic acid biosynthesis glycosyltransferase TuaG
VYNASKFIARVLQCVSDQNFIECEHILVDDCSQDNSYELLTQAALKNSYIKVIRLPINSGPVVARNEALRLASGKYIAFLDADDYWMPNKLKIQLKFMEENNATLCFTDYRFITEDGALVGKRISGFNKIGWTQHHITRYLGCLTMMVNRERVPDFHFPNIAPSVRAEDFFAWSRILLIAGPALRCPYDLARYSVVSNSRSSNSFAAARSVWSLYVGVEKIPLVKAVPYFIAYIFSAGFKRFLYKPKFISSNIDGKLSKKYLLGGSE